MGKYRFSYRFYMQGKKREKKNKVVVRREGRGRNPGFIYNVSRELRPKCPIFVFPICKSIASFHGRPYPETPYAVEVEATSDKRQAITTAGLRKKKEKNINYPPNIHNVLFSTTSSKLCT
jgi:hypothetical protein